MIEELTVADNSGDNDRWFHRTLTQAELLEELAERFGPDRWRWAFRCPACDDVATAADFRDAGADPGRVGRECIGRHLGALGGGPDGGRATASRGCDWAAYGLLRGPWTIVMPDGKELPSFAIADAGNAVNGGGEDAATAANASTT